MTKRYGITKASGARIAKGLSRIEGNRFGTTGETPGPPGDDPRGPWLGKTQTSISPGATPTPNVNFWNGPKGQETDSGVTVPVYLRSDFTTNPIGPNKFVIFDLIDQGYEITVANPCG